MPDMEKLAQVQMLSNLLSTMPPQHGQTKRIPFPKGKAQQWASELVNEYGVRVHVDLAARTQLPDGVEVLGDEPRRVDDVVGDVPRLLALLRTYPNMPSLVKLADEIEESLGDPDKERAVLDSIRANYPDIMKTAQLLADKVKPEDLA
jgi:hypothetical protein